MRWQRKALPLHFFPTFMKFSTHTHRIPSSPISHCWFCPHRFVSPSTSTICDCSPTCWHSITIQFGRTIWWPSWNISTWILKYVHNPPPNVNLFLNQHVFYTLAPKLPIMVNTLCIKYNKSQQKDSVWIKCAYYFNGQVCIKSTYNLLKYNFCSKHSTKQIQV
jgi:hypothetical protein